MKSRIVCLCACIFTCLPASLFSQTTALRAFAASGGIMCHGGYALVQITAAGGDEPYSGIGEFMVPAGNYTYTVTDAANNTAVVPITIEEPAELVTSVKAGNFLSGSITSIEVTATGGITPYTGTGNFTADAGINTYQVTDANGCPSVKTINLAEVSPAPENTVPVIDTITVLSASATWGTILCNGGTTTVAVAAAGGMAPYTGTGTFTVSAGKHTYTITDAAGNNCYTTVDIPEPAALAITITSEVDMGSCSKSKTNIAVNTSGGVLPYHYNLNAGQYQEISRFNDLSEGSYNVIVKDGNGCIALAPVEVSKPVQFRAWFKEVADVSSCGFIDGYVTVTEEGGIAPFQYKINNGYFQNSNMFDTLPADEYAVVVKDKRGCETAAFTAIKKSGPLLLSVASTIAVSSCNNNDGAIRVSASGGGGGYTYCINGGGYQSSSSFTQLSAGEYTITVKDWRGCTKSITAGILKTPQLVAKITGTTNAGTCADDGTIQVGFTGGTAPYTYSINGSAFETNNWYDHLAAGIYNLCVKEGRGCISSAVAVISKAPVLAISAIATPVTCTNGADGSIAIDYSGGIGPYQYSLNGQTFSTTNIFHNLEAGRYQAVIKDSKGCIAAQTVKIQEGTGNCVSGIPINFNADASGRLKVLVLPNPSPTTFTLLTSSSGIGTTAIIVTDISGKTVYKATGVVNQQFTFGNDFAPGIYLVRIIQGWQSKQVKIVKTRGQ